MSVRSAVNAFIDQLEPADRIAAVPLGHGAGHVVYLDHDGGESRDRSDERNHATQSARCRISRHRAQEAAEIATWK